MKKKNLILVGCIILIVIIIFLINVNRPDETKAIKVGAILPLTGAGSAAGNYVKQALELTGSIYEEEISNLGYRFQLVIEDSKSSSKDGVEAFQKISLTEPSIKVIFSQMSSVASSILPLAKDKKDIIISISSSVEPIKTYQWFFCNYLSAKTQADIYFEFFKNSEQITLYYVNDDYGTSIKNEMAKLCQGNKRLNDVGFEVNTDIKNLVLKQFPSKGGVIIIAYGNTFSEIIKYLRLYNYQGHVMCSPELLSPPVLEALQGLEDNVYSIDFEPLPEAIKKKFNTTYKRDPTIGDILAFNGLSLVIESYLKLIRSKMNTFEPEAVVQGFFDQEVLNRVPGIKLIENQIFVYKVRIVSLRE